MNVLLVAARRSPHTGEWITAPFQGLLSLAAVLRAGTFRPTRGVRLTIVDEQIEFLRDPAAPAGWWLDGHHPDVVGVQACTSSLKNALALLRAARARFPGVLTVLGGPGLARGAEAVLQHGGADVVVEGEGEATFSELIDAFGNGGRAAIRGVDGIVYLSDDGVPIRSARRPQIPDIDALPFPARDLVDMRTYRRVSRGRAGNLITSRGCSYACSYCYSKHQWGVGQRRRSVARTLEEIRVLLEEHGIDRIRIEDDDFLEDRGWVLAFCDALLAQGLARRIEWEAKARPDHIDEELAGRLRRSGCFRLLMGVETLDPSLLRRVGRTVKVATLEAALELLRTQGVGVQATVILGLPGETDQAMRYTLTWLEERLRTEHDIVSPCFFVPFYEAIGQDMGRRLPFTIEVRDTDLYTGHVPVVSSPACSLEELQRLNEDMQESRRGMYARVAHLAQEDEVYRRLGSVW